MGRELTLHLPESPSPKFTDKGYEYREKSTGATNEMEPYRGTITLGSSSATQLPGGGAHRPRDGDTHFLSISLHSLGANLVLSKEDSRSRGKGTCLKRWLATAPAAGDSISQPHWGKGYGLSWVACVPAPNTGVESPPGVVVCTHHDVPKGSVEDSTGPFASVRSSSRNPSTQPRNHP